MGAYLSEPITEKLSSDEVGDSAVFGASSMQGWRISQEDAHNCCLNFDKDVSLFAVYDGHGGHEVATYCAQNLPQFIKDTEAYKNGDIEKALKDAFLGFDATLAKPEIVAILKEIAGTSSSGGKEKGETDNNSDEEENVSNLRMEAAMPLEQVMAKYQAEVANPALKALKKDKDGKPASPYLRARRAGARDKPSSFALAAGCSSSSWHDNEADVSSSSSQLCGSTWVAAKEPKPPKPEPVAECIGSSEADQVLDSTTSNGDSAAVPSSEVGGVQAAKSSDMPDSSEDIKDLVSPSKIAQAAPNAPEEAEVNGAEENKMESQADSSKGGGDNVTSSSCSTLENGEAGQQERISSSGRRRPVDYGLLCINDGSEEDDDDEEDETFDGQPESDDEDDDTEDVDDVDDDDNEDDSDEDEDVDPDDDDDEFTMKMTEEPGSDSGCTAVVAVLAGRELYVANAGDSRCVLCRNGQALELSLDHKPEDEPEMTRIVKAGGKVTADGRVNGGLNLSRALGDHAYKQNMELLPQEQMISAEPDIKRATIDPEQDEFMVLACDGIWNFMSSQDVVQFVNTRLKQGYEKVSQICEELFDHCLAPNTLGDGTGCDNMTAVIVRFKKPSASTGTASAALTETEVTVPTQISNESKKRPASPIPKATEGNISTGEDTAADSKRPKTEAV